MNRAVSKRLFQGIHLSKWFRILAMGLFLVMACGREGATVKVLAGDQGAVREKFSVELANTPEKRALGLMYRKDLGPGEGMLFIFPYLVDGPFWMKNTLIPLDILFISEAKKIVTIVPQAQPQTETPRESLDLYLYVLEIPGGRAAATGIQVGDRLQFDVPPAKY